jgi:protein-L-isoaspartate(D-aspartate) O-methyltransferase
MTNEALAAKLIRQHSIHTPRVIEAFLSVDRADFVPEQYKDQAYDDVPLPIGFGATISQPSTVAFMIENLDVQPKHRVLDIGSGSGWTTALLSELAAEEGKVIGTEINSDVLNFGQDNLDKYDYQQTILHPAGKSLGIPDQAPFDRILVSAAAEKSPNELIAQLADGGVMVIPIGHSLFKIIKNTPETIQVYEYPGYSFVPLL